jgi:hypothetical protein
MVIGVCPFVKEGRGMPQFLDGGEVPAGLLGSVDVQIGDAQSAFCTMTDLLQVTREVQIAYEGREFGIHITRAIGITLG